MATTTTSSESVIRCSHERIKSAKLTFAADVTGGTWDFLNNTVGLIPESVDVSEEDEGAFYYEIEDVLAPKKTGQTWTVLQQLYFDSTLDNFTNVQNGGSQNKKSGFSLEAAGTAATTGRMNLIGKQNQY